MTWPQKNAEITARPTANKEIEPRISRIRRDGFFIREIREIRGQKSSRKRVKLTDSSAKKNFLDRMNRIGRRLAYGRQVGSGFFESCQSCSSCQSSFVFSCSNSLVATLRLCDFALKSPRLAQRACD
jgi:hypothetical protein